MAKLKWDHHEFISNSFLPQIAVASTSSAEAVCRKNSLTFIELLAPFCKLNAEAQLKDAGGTSTPIKNLRVQLVDINARPPQAALARKFMNQSVNVGSENIRTVKITVGNNNQQVEIPMHVPWFDNWRETFFQVQFPSDHEFTRHYLACIFVISSSEDEPLEALNTLIQHLNTLQNSAQAKVPKWFISNVLKYFVLLHDTNEANYDNAMKLYETLKQTYNANNCYFLPINSRPNDLDSIQQCLPDPWAQYLTRRQRKNSSPTVGSVPSTPTDSGSFGMLPNNLGSTQSESTADLSKSSKKLEVGQEANEVTATTSGVQYHPLSPENESRSVIVDESESVPPLNSNVWRGSPSVNLASGIHGNCLSVNDVECIKTLITEFCTKSLIPYVEKLIQNLTEQISSKKGVSRSLFSATKRWFTPSKPGASNPGTTPLYSNDSTEIQLRRLGDLYFMFGNYPMAFNAYHTVKRDFYADQAFLYYAGALEMAGLAAFMGGDLHRKWIEYLDESITTYSTSCKMQQFATRATLFSTECLKYKKMYGEAANQYIRMTSEDSDLRSALLLEQASYCFLNCTRPKMIRKYAFHIVLSGHRFSKCAQRKHSLRCYRQAFEVYNGKNWSLAEDHIHYTIGRQACALSLLEEATNSFSKLLKATSRQATHQQAIFLKEYLLAHQSLIEERKRQQIVETGLPQLPIPIIKVDETKVLLGQQQPLRTPGRIPASSITFMSNFDDPLHSRWNKLEQIMYQQLNTLPPIFKPQVTFFTTRSMNTTANSRPLAIIGEPIQISVCLDNTLHIALPLKDLYVLWRFNGENNTAISNEGLSGHSETDSIVKTHVLKQVCIPASVSQDIVLSITPLAVGDLVIEGICYTLQNTIPENAVGQYCVAGKQLLVVKGQRLKDKDCQPQYAPDRKIEIQVTSSAPCLQVNFTEMTQELLANEIVHLNVELRNSGSMPLHNILMASTVPHLFTQVISSNDKYSEKNFDWTLQNEGNIYCNHITLPENLNGRLEPGQSHTINLWLRAPSTPGRTSLDLLFYYENVNLVSIPRYRLVRHQWHFAIQDSLELDMQVQPSFGQNTTETVAMSLTAFNSNQLHHAVVSEISLDHASLFSQRWTLINKSNKTKDAVIKLQSQETVHVLLKACRTISNSEKPNYTKKLFKPKQNRPNEKDIQAACLDFARKVFWLEPTINMNQTDPPPSQNGPPQEKSKPEALLIVGWQAVITDSAGNRRIAIGQNHLPIMTMSWGCASRDSSFVLPIKNDLSMDQSIIQPLLGAENNLPSLQKQVTYNMIHASNVTHDFSKNIVCIIPVTVIINSTVQAPLIVKVNTLGTSNENQMSSSRYELTNPQSSSNFRWIGHSEFRTELKGFTSKQLALKCAFTAPGTYDLGGRIEILCRSPDSPYAADMQNVSYDSSVVITGIC